MKREGSRIVPALAASLALAVACCTVAAPRDNINDWAWLSDVEARRRPPFRIFDNVAYVGLDWVSCYLIETSAGLILIDALYEPYTETLLDNIRALGHDPADVTYVIVTHGHWDHAGGAHYLQQKFGARVVMGAADWDLVARDSGSGNTRFTPPREDLALGDRDTLTLGDTTLTFHLTPGHTDGSLSVEFPARDGESTWRALTYGGVGINFSDPERLKTYGDSVRRIMARGPYDVSLTNHPGMARIFPRARELAARGHGESHPFVDRAAMETFLEQRLQAARPVPMETPVNPGTRLPGVNETETQSCLVNVIAVEV